jgi:hypothetical protein
VASVVPTLAASGHPESSAKTYNQLHSVRYKRGWPAFFAGDGTERFTHVLADFLTRDAHQVITGRRCAIAPPSSDLRS